MRSHNLAYTGHPARLGAEHSCKAIRTLQASDMKEARRRATTLLRRSKKCPCCHGLLDHVFTRIGSTLFLDDDPEKLALAFQPDEREHFSPQLLAACIILSGRQRTRVPVYPD